MTIPIETSIRKTDGVLFRGQPLPEAPICPKCGEPKTAQFCRYLAKGFRWMCMPCFRATQKAQHTNPQRHEIINKPKQLDRKPEKVTTPHQDLVREYRRMERAWPLWLARVRADIATMAAEEWRQELIGGQKG